MVVLTSLNLAANALCGIEMYGDGTYDPSGIQALSDALASGRAVLKSINLGGNSLGTEGWCAIFHALRDNKDNKIESWNLSQQGINPKIAKALAEYISVSAVITNLDMRFNDITGEAAQQLSSAVLASPSLEVFSEVPIKELRADSSLTELSLEGKSLGPTEAMVIAALIEGSAVLTSLNLEANNIRNEGAIAIAEALKSGSAVLTSLNLFDNEIGNDGAIALADALKSGKSVLKELNLAENALCGIDRRGRGTYNPSGIQALAAALSSGSAVLTSLNLKNNNIRNEGAIAIAEALKSGSAVLTSLNLFDNEIGNDGAIALADALKSGKSVLKELNLAENALCGIDRRGRGTYNPSGIQALAAALSSGSAVLTSLNLKNNNIRNEGAIAIAEALKSGSSVLKTLSLADNQLCGLNSFGLGTYDPSGIQAIAAALSGGSSVLATIDLRDNFLGDDETRTLTNANKRRTTPLDLKI
eukprot:CAMPEP_0174754326 /NCGR_PEP_ID=MMETSP1094-20130205/105680_1 /TAXON_ID=156173 /ORGANISM="Chrysochromulina brevifilum, Strain UTEX LB 985" /LENGTH=473 /DNA_ID=CAMNT_0015960191 /DNA_START=36 /DNA_END=1457 /DNA_ORIENTATION=-